ncbi:MAG: biotin/lipoyl-binding protein, partial [Gammaproteobacteria bacterium]
MAHVNQKTFEQIGVAAAKASRVSSHLFGRLTTKLTDNSPLETSDWAGDADWAQLQQEPLRARLLLRSALLVVVVLIFWASWAEIDEVTRGEAKVVPTSQVQIIQSVDGGVVEEIMVREGQLVEAGQLLLRVDPTRFASTLGESRVNQLALRAKAERLQALTQGRLFNPSQDLLREAPEIVAQERSLFESRRAEISAQISIT